MQCFQYYLMLGFVHIIYLGIIFFNTSIFNCVLLKGIGEKNKIKF